MQLLSQKLFCIKIASTSEFEIDAIESEYEDDHGDEDDSGEDRGQESNPEEDVKEILETKSNSQTTKEHSEPKETQNLTKVGFMKNYCFL